MQEKIMGHICPIGRSRVKEHRFKYNCIFAKKLVFLEDCASSGLSQDSSD